MFKCPRPGKLFSSVSGVVGCVTVLVSARALGGVRVRPSSLANRCAGPEFFFLTRTNRDVPRS